MAGKRPKSLTKRSMINPWQFCGNYLDVGGGARPLSIWNLFQFHACFFGSAAKFALTTKSIRETGKIAGKAEQSGGQENRKENLLQLALEKFLALIDLL